MDSNTAKFDLSGDRTADVHALMSYVLSALKEKGYNPINQLVSWNSSTMMYRNCFLHFASTSG